MAEAKESFGTTLKYVIKGAAVKAKDKTDFVRNEVLAQTLYSGIRELLGNYNLTDVDPDTMSPRSKLVKPKTGTPPLIASEYYEDIESFGSFKELTERIENPADLTDDFLACALLGIWDTQLDNVFVLPLDVDAKGSKGRLFRLDFGGSMNYRAQGKLKKPGEFGVEVDEVENLFSKKYAASKLYNYIKTDDVFLQRLFAFKLMKENGDIDVLLDQAVSLRGPLDPVQRQALRDKLGARAESLTKWADSILDTELQKVAGGDTVTTKAPAPEPTPDSLKKIYVEPVKVKLPEKVPVLAPERAEGLADGAKVAVEIDTSKFNPAAPSIPVKGSLSENVAYIGFK